jgi:KUP system potassium uptake protein
MLANDPLASIDVAPTETLVPGERPQLGRWRTWLYMQLASNALSPARFYHLPPNRVVELGTQVTI